MTDMSVNNSRFSGTRQRPRSTRSSVSRSPMSAPSNAMRPAKGSRPIAAVSSVVLPAPFGPITVTIWPAADFERDVAHRLGLVVAHADALEAQQRAHATPPR